MCFPRCASEISRFKRREFRPLLFMVAYKHEQRLRRNHRAASVACKRRYGWYLKRPMQLSATTRCDELSAGDNQFIQLGERIETHANVPIGSRVPSYITTPPFFVGLCVFVHGDLQVVVNSLPKAWGQIATQDSFFSFVAIKCRLAKVTRACDDLCRLNVRFWRQRIRRNGQAVSERCRPKFLVASRAIASVTLSGTMRL